MSPSAAPFKEQRKNVIDIPQDSQVLLRRSTIVGNYQLHWGCGTANTPAPTKLILVSQSECEENEKM
jgi:hypothetical protein